MSTAIYRIGGSPSLFDESLDQLKDKRIYRIHAKNMEKEIFDGLLKKFKSKGIIFDQQKRSAPVERSAVFYGPPAKRKFLFS